MSLDTITLDDALKLLTIPRVVGELEGEEVVAHNGKFGPYLKKGTDSRSLGSEDDLLTVTIDQAKELFAQPKQRGRGRAAAAAPLRELGDDPNSKKPVVVKEGRFGPYVTDGETNASLRKGDTVEDITIERAAELLAERRERAPAPKKTTTRKAPHEEGSGQEARGQVVDHHIPAAAVIGAAGSESPQVASFMCSSCSSWSWCCSRTRTCGFGWCAARRGLGGCVRR